MKLDALIAVQYGIVRREQLLRAGLAPATIRARLGSGEWQRVLPGVYALFTGALDVRHRQVSGWLYAGACAQLAGPTAIRLYGLRRGPADHRVHLLVPHHRQVASVQFAVIHRTSRLESLPQRVAPILVCSVPRAIADTARWSPDGRTVRALVAEAVQRRFTTLDALRAESASGRRNGSALLRTALDEVAAGMHSASEADLRTSLMQSRILPEILWSPRLVALDGRSLPSPDGWIDEGGIGLEADSKTDIQSPDDWERAMARHALLAQYGVLVLHFPPARLRRDPAGVRVAVERAYVQRRDCGARAAVTAQPP